MADKPTPAEKAAESALTKKLTLQLLVSDPEMRDLQAKDAQIRAVAGTRGRHAAIMEDHQSGRALDRGIAAFETKASIADYASAKGRKVNGEIPAPTLPVVPAGDKVESAVEASATA